MSEHDRENDPEHDPGFAFIGAVHELLASSRSTQKTDLILAAVLQALYEADREVAEICRRVGQIWPGAVQDDEDIHRALEVGSELLLIARTESLDDGTVWTLTKRGADDVRQHADWVAEVRVRAREQIRERATTGLLADFTPDQADLILDRLVTALAHVIRRSQAPYVGQIDALLHTGRANQRVAPRALDRAALLSAVGSADDDPTSKFVRGLALAAIDPLDPFGNELVSHITTGCVLYAFVAGVDRQRLLNRLGDPTGQWAVIDTPLLIDLIGPSRLSSGIALAIEAAKAAGWHVVALDHSIREAQEVLQRDVPAIKEDLRDAIEHGARQTWYASLSEDQLPSLCVEVLEDGTYRNLEQLLSAVDQLPERLEALGVVVQAQEIGDDSSVQRFYDALAEQLEGNKPRSEVVMRRDAQTMATVWRRRLSQHGSRWPGGWVVTKDRHMAPAFLRAQQRDKVSLTLSGTQWATLLSVSAQPADVERLASAAADQFLDEAAWTLPIRYPPDVAMDLARQLSDEHGGSDTDLRVAQMTLDEALEEPTASAVASVVLSDRAKRINRITETDRERLAVGLADAKEHAIQASERAAQSDIQRLQGEQEIASLTNDNSRLTTDLDWRGRQLKRVVVSAAAAVVATALLVVSLFVAGALTICLFAAGLCVLGYGLYRWCTEEGSRIWPILLGSAIDVIGVVSGLMQIFAS